VPGGSNYRHRQAL